MIQSHWCWCKQGPILEGIKAPVAKRVLEEVDIHPCPCNMVTDDMPFIHLSWLLDEKCNLCNLPPMQELPEETFIYTSEMRYSYFISHRWLARDHESNRHW